MVDRAAGAPVRPPTDSVEIAVRAEARRWRRLILLTVLLLALVFAGLVNYGVFGVVPNPEIPEVLRGTWVTDDVRYAGRRLRLDANLVTLVVGDSAAAELHPVYDVTRRAGAGADRYTITYLIGRDELTLTVIHRPPLLELAHPEGVVWRRTP